MGCQSATFLIKKTRYPRFDKRLTPLSARFATAFSSHKHGQGRSTTWCLWINSAFRNGPMRLSNTGLCWKCNVGNSGPIRHPDAWPFLSGQLRFSVFLARHINLTTTLRQNDCPALSFMHQKLNDLFMKSWFWVRKKAWKSARIVFVTRMWCFAHSAMILTM